MNNKLILTLFGIGFLGNGLGSFFKSMQWEISKPVFMISALVIVIAFFLMVIKLVSSKKFKESFKKES